MGPYAPSQTVRRSGGRLSQAADLFLLRGLAFCRECGSPMYVRSDSVKTYNCKLARKHTGLCHAKPIDARQADQHVLDHVSYFVGSVEDWINEKVQARSGEQANRERLVMDAQAHLAKLVKARAARVGELEQVGMHPIALEVIANIDSKIEQANEKIKDAQAALDEHTAPADVDAALHYYIKLTEVIAGNTAGASGVEELNAALSTVIAGIWMVRDSDNQLTAEFELKPLEATPTNGLAQVLSQDLAGRRMTLPSPNLTGPTEADLVSAGLVPTDNGLRTIGIRSSWRS
jgi:hypothetical protein